MALMPVESTGGTCQKSSKRNEGKMDFKPGEVVQLKSGGRGMTVVRQSKEDVDVIWYADSEDAVRTATIPAACLSLIEFEDDEEEFEDEDED
jgi:uncharacterized protein YodC (DUF2158 family)